MHVIQENHDKVSIGTGVRGFQGWKAEGRDDGQGELHSMAMWGGEYKAYSCQAISHKTFSIATPTVQC